MLLSCGKHETVTDVDANLSQSEFSCTNTRARHSQGTAHIQGNDTAEKMGKINVAPLLVLMLQVGILPLVVKGKPMTTLVRASDLKISNNKRKIMLLFSLLLLLEKCIHARNFQRPRINMIKNRLF